MNKIFRTFLSTIKEHSMIRRGDRVIVAISGGPDSVCLSHLLRLFRDHLGLEEIVLAHINYRKRGEESENDELFVRRLSEEFALPLYVKRITPSTHSRVKKENFQKWARNVRYGYFRKILEDVGGSRIALGHTIDDQAETVLVRFLEGGGLEGMKGIPYVSGDGIIRPLLDLDKGEILSYLDGEGFPFRVDSSNVNGDFQRNRVRNEVIPFLSNHMRRDVRRTIINAGDVFRQLEEMVSSEVNGAFKAAFDMEEGIIHIGRYGEFPEIVRKLLVKKIGYDHLGQKFNRRLIEKIDYLFTRGHPSFSLKLPGGYNLSRSYDEARILKGDGVPPPYSIIISGPGTYETGKGKEGIRVSIATAENIRPLIEKARTDPYFCVLDGESVSFPLEVRSFIEGDRVIPFGMKRRRKLKKLFIEQKVPIPDRKKTPIVLSGDHIIWVPGVVRSAHHTLVEENKIIIVLEYKGN